MYIDKNTGIYKEALNLEGCNLKQKNRPLSVNNLHGRMLPMTKRFGAVFVVKWPFGIQVILSHRKNCLNGYMSPSVTRYDVKEQKHDRGTHQFLGKDN